MNEDYFLPRDFEAFLRPQIGEKIADTLFSALHDEPETGVRLNKMKNVRMPLYPDMTQVEWCAEGYHLDTRPKFTLNPLLHAGAFYVQDPSSMVVERIVARLVGECPVLAADLCAAPGGKTTAIINALPDGSALLANEFVASRASILKENLIKNGYPDVVVTNTAISRLLPLGPIFDLVVVDAPCSGEGMMRKDESARAQWSEGLVRQCAALQREILADAAQLVAPGGHIIYSTCTFNTIENEDNAAWLAENFWFDPVDIRLVGDGGILPEVKGEIPCLRFMPGFTRGEGLFVSIFRRPDYPGAVIKPLRKTKKKEISGKRGKSAAEAAIMSKASSWIKPEAGIEIKRHDDRLLALSPQTATLLDAIPKGVHIISAGVEITEVKGKDLIPSHALAMSPLFSRIFPEMELSEEDALRFLSRETITLPPSVPTGYITMTYHGLPLGFLKNIGNRTNSLYPREYRIMNITKGESANPE